jgi:hypothetical protein
MQARISMEKSGPYIKLFFFLLYFSPRREKTQSPTELWSRALKAKRTGNTWLPNYESADSGGALVFTVRALNIASCLHVHAYDFAGSDEERHLNADSIVERSFLPGAVLTTVGR